LAFAVLLLVPTALLRDPEHAVFWAGMAFLGFLQVTAFVLNMLPVPGLDGYSVLEPHLSPQTQRKLEPLKQWGLIVLIVLLFTPQLNRWFFSLVFWFVELFGVPSGLAMAGMELTRFWSIWF
jgi:Zn-dependent protease